MTASRPTASAVHTTLTFRKWIAVAGLTLLNSACAGDGPVAPMATPEPVAMARAVGSGAPAACVPNARLIGRIEVSTAYEQGTWWYLTRTGMDKAGLTDYRATIEGWFGQQFSSQSAAIAFLVAQAGLVDVNRNGFICAYTLRGTRTSIGDPEYALTLFGTRDDAEARK